MKKKAFLKCLLLTSCIFLQFAGLAQVGPTTEVRSLKAKFGDTTTTKNLKAIFLVTVRDSVDFPPIINLPPKCTVFENGREKVLVIGPQNLSLLTWGENIREKNKEAYDLIKDQVDLKKLGWKGMIIIYELKDINFAFKKMSMTPSFKEKRHPDIKIEKRFEFEVQ